MPCCPQCKMGAEPHAPARPVPKHERVSDGQRIFRSSADHRHAQAAAKDLSIVVAYGNADKIGKGHAHQHRPPEIEGIEFSVMRDDGGNRYAIGVERAPRARRQSGPRGGFDTSNRSPSIIKSRDAVDERFALSRVE